mgnify:CR=1 FL=1
MSQCANDSFFQPVYILFDKVPSPLQVQQGVCHDLPRSMVGHLSPSVSRNHRNIAGIQNMTCQARQTLGENGRVFTQPQHVWRFQVALGREILHGLVSVQVVDLAEERDLHVENERQSV